MERIGEIKEREEFVIEWSIKDFLSLLIKGVSFFSPLFNFDNACWCLETCLNVEKEEESSEFIYMYLHRKSSGLPIRMEYSFGIKTSKYELHDDKLTHVFKETERRGIKWMCSRKYLSEEKSDFLPSDTIILVCRIQSSPFIKFANHLLQTYLENIQVCSKNNLTCSDMKTTGEIHERQDFVKEWSIKEFLSLPEDNGITLFSPSFSFHNVSWCIQIYPNGLQDNESDKSIQLHLHKLSLDPPIKMEYSFGLKTGMEEHYGGFMTHVFDEIESFGLKWNFTRNYFEEKKSEFLPSETLFVTCRIKCTQFKEFSNSSNTVTTGCSYCNKTLNAQEEDISTFLRDWENLPIKCEKCGNDVAIKKWLHHKCEMTEAEGLSNTVAAKCSYCSKTLDAHEDITSHLRKCEDFPINCQKCGDDIALKKWYDHKCQSTKLKVKLLNPLAVNQLWKRN